MATIDEARVAVAFDAGISLTRFARALSDAGLVLTMKGGVLSVLDRSEEPRKAHPRRRAAKTVRRNARA
jgi:hypothetical protein